MKCHVSTRSGKGLSWSLGFWLMGRREAIGSRVQGGLFIARVNGRTWCYPRVLVLQTIRTQGVVGSQKLPLTSKEGLVGPVCGTESLWGLGSLREFDAWSCKNGVCAVMETPGSYWCQEHGLSTEGSQSGRQSWPRRENSSGKAEEIDQMRASL